jgi:MerR family transcriptional regulator, light-induced transcriptional regulator
MPEEFAGSYLPHVPQLLRARDHLARRGQALSDSALRVLAREVILRVSRAAPATLPPEGLPTDAEIEALCDALTSTDDKASSDMVRDARLGGMSADALYHAFIAEAARRLGRRWERDEASAAEVILAAGRIYAILRDLREAFLVERLTAPLGAEAVFASVPGEVHGIGVTIAADTLRRKGWEVTLRQGLGHEALVEEIARLQPTMIGLSAAQTGMTFATARLIVALRVRCPQVWVLVGGPIVEQDPDIARIVDADAAAADIETGAALLGQHLEELNKLRVQRSEGGGALSPPSPPARR